MFVNRRTLVQSGLKSDDEQIASHLQYFGMWGDSPAAGPNSTSAFTNLHLPYGCSTSLCSASEFPSKMFNLVPLRWLMWNCTTKPGQINGGLKTSWRDAWTAASAHYAPMIANNSAQGFMLGDELVWQGCTVEAIALLAEAVRADFPTAPIYYNENVPVVLHGRNGGGRAVNFSLPEALTWFSFDYYHYDGKDDGAHVQTVRSVYQDHVYPKMKPQQRVLLVPGAFDMPAGATIPGGFKCNTSCFDSMGADDAAHYWAWAQADDRVVGLAPWEWHDGGGRLGSWHMPQTRAAWEIIGRKVLSAACVKSDDNEGSASHVHLFAEIIKQRYTNRLSNALIREKTDDDEGSSSRQETIKLVPLPPAAPWRYAGGHWNATGENPAGTTAAPSNLGVGPGDNLAFWTGGQPLAGFRATFDFRFQLAGAIDYPGPAGFIFGAQNATSFYVLEFPAVGQAWRTEVEWVSLSHYRSDGWRQGIKIWRVPEVSSTPGIWHSVDVTLDPTGAVGGRALFSVSVDGVPLEPLSDGQKQANGKTIVLTPLVMHTGWTGFLGSNGQGSFAKPQFRKFMLAPITGKVASLPGPPPWNISVEPPNPSNLWNQEMGCCSTLTRCPEGQILTMGFANSKHGINNDTLALSTDQGRSFRYGSGPRGNSSAGCLFRCVAGGTLECYRLTGIGGGHGETHTMTKATASGGPAGWFGQVSEWTPARVVHSLVFPSVWGVPDNGSSLTELAGPMSPVEIPPQPLTPNGTLAMFAYTADCSPEPCQTVQPSGFSHIKSDWGGINIAFASTDGGESFTMSKLDSNPAFKVAHDAMDRKARGSEISAAATADGGLIALVRSNFAPQMWHTRTMARTTATTTVAGAPGTWMPLSRGAFEMSAAASSMLRTVNGAIVIGGRFPLQSIFVSYDDGHSWHFFSMETRCGGNGAMVEVSPNVVMYLYGRGLGPPQGPPTHVFQLFRVTTEPPDVHWVGLHDTTIKTDDGDTNEQLTTVDTVVLGTVDTRIVLTAHNGQVFITSLKNPLRDWEWISSPSPLPLIVPVGGADWQYLNMTTNHNQTKVTLHFESASPALELTSVWLVCTGGGPVENSMIVRNMEPLNTVKWGSLPPPPPPPPPGRCVSILNQTWVVGGDYDAFPLDTADPAPCAAACCHDKRCLSFGFDAPGAVGRGPVGRCNGVNASRFCCWLKSTAPLPQPPPRPGKLVMGGYRPGAEATVAVRGINITVRADQPVELSRFSKTTYGMSTIDQFGLNASTVIETHCGENEHIPLGLLSVGDMHGLYIGHEWELGSFEVRAGADKLDLSVEVSPITEVLSIASGKSFTVPSVYYGAYDGDMDDGSNSLKLWFWDHKVPRSLHENADEPWTEICYGKGHGGRFGLSCGCALPQSFYDAAAASGVEAVKQDFGWYGNSTGDPNSRNWQFRKKDWPDGFNFKSRAHEAGLKTSLYMGGSYNDVDLKTIAGRNTQLAYLAKIYDAGWFDMWRTDTYNAPEDPMPATFNGVTNFYYILDSLISSRPGFRYENCANGGRYKGFSTARRMTFMTTNDNDGGGQLGAGADYRASVWTAGYALNSIQLKSDVGVHPGYPWPAAAVSIKVAYMARTSMLGAWQLCGVEPNNTIYRQHLALYKTKQRPILRGAGMYHVLPKPDGVNWDGELFFNKRLNKGSLFLFKPSPNVTDTMVVKLKGLEQPTQYKLTFQERHAQSCVKSGAELMGTGVTVAGMVGSFASEIVWLN